MSSMPRSSKPPAMFDPDADTLELLMDLTGEGAWRWDAATDRLRPSARWHAVTGLDATGDAADRAWLMSFIVEEDRPIAADAFARWLAGEDGHACIYRLRVDGGEPRWIRDRARVAARDADGRVRALVGSVTDVSDSQAREARLRRDLERFRALADGVPAAIFRYVLHADGTDSMDYMSPGCEAIWEIGPAQIRSDPSVLWEMVHPDDLPAMRDSVARSARTLSPWSHIWRVTTASGREKWLRGSGTPCRGEDGSIAWSSLILDISDRMEAEETTRRAMEQAETANRAKTEFLAHMSHELRTPLNSIVGFSEIMSREMFGPHASNRYREYSEAIHGSATHLRTLLSDILDVSMIEAGDMPLNESWFDLDGAVEFCLELLRERIRRGGLRCECRLSRSGLRIHGDAVRIKQVLLNVLSNAVKFTDPGGRIRLSDRADAAGYHILVRDDGIGIAPDDLPLVTEAFHQVRQDARIASEGSGLGLYISREIMALHQGRLTLTSAPGEGTEVTITLPPERLRRDAPHAR